MVWSALAWSKQPHGLHKTHIKWSKCCQAQHLLENLIYARRIQLSAMQGRSRGYGAEGRDQGIERGNRGMANNSWKLTGTKETCGPIVGLLLLCSIGWEVYSRFLCPDSAACSSLAFSLRCSGTISQCHHALPNFQCPMSHAPYSLAVAFLRLINIA